MEEWKNDIINSLQGIKRATPPSATFEKVLAKIEAQPKASHSPSKQWIAVAAAISLIVLANIYVLSSRTSPESFDVGSNGSSPQLISNYNLY